MSVADFEGDQDLAIFGVELGNAPDGALLVNAEKIDEFDHRIQKEVEGLLYLGRLTKDVEIYGHTVTLRTLTRGERIAAALFCKEYEGSLGIGDAMELAYLALSITSVDGRALSIPLSKNETIAQHLARNYATIENWYDPIIDALYREYSGLLVRSQLALDELEGKLKAGRATPKP